MNPLKTPRLELWTVSPEVARLAVVSRKKAGERLGLEISRDWPSRDLREALPELGRFVEHNPEAACWGIWLIVHAAARMVIGDIGFRGPADQTGTLEIGYSVVPGFRQQGFASEAAGALAQWAFGQPEVRRIIARCRMDNLGSIRVLERTGFRRTANEGGMTWWELPSHHRRG